MKVTATQKFIRTSPRKLRLVANAVKGLPPKEAVAALSHVEKRAAEPITKVLKTAIANAKNNFNLSEENLKLTAIEVLVGPVLKRGRPVSRGQYHQIKKRTSHIVVTLSGEERHGTKN